MLGKIPREVCILKLSAIGDVCHTLPVIRTLQHHWPDTRFTWVIGKTEAKLMSLIPEIEFITFDKRKGLGEIKRFRALMRGRSFDLLLHMQMALRASLLSTFIPARVKLGYDRGRARELQWMFTTHRIASRGNEHVMDSLFGFAEALGAHDRQMRWDFPLGEAELAYVQRLATQRRPLLVISPCSSHPRRNWRAEYYAQVADHAARVHGMQVVLSGGPSDTERAMGEAIVSAMKQPVTNTIGRDTLPQMLAVLKHAAVLLSPDSGPVHMATAMGTPVLGLYAATNPERSGPYFSRSSCVNRYDEAARKFYNKPAKELKWTTKIEKPGVMDLIKPEDVIAKLNSMMRQRHKKPVSLT